MLELNIGKKKKKKDVFDVISRSIKIIRNKNSNFMQEKEK